jgi:hypothetical protein
MNITQAGEGTDHKECGGSSICEHGRQKRSLQGVQIPYVNMGDRRVATKGLEAEVYVSIADGRVSWSAVYLNMADRNQWECKNSGICEHNFGKKK